jgi:hypothetical protein
MPGSESPWLGEDLTGGVKGRAQIIRGHLPARVGPKKLHCLLSVYAMSRSQGEELHQAGRLPQVPGILGYGCRPYGNPKASEQPYPHSLVFLAFRNLEPPHTLTPIRRLPLPSPLTLCLGIYPPAECALLVTCRGTPHCVRRRADPFPSPPLGTSPSFLCFRVRIAPVLL